MASDPPEGYLVRDTTPADTLLVMVRERLAALRPLVQEYDQLQDADNALAKVPSPKP